MKFAVQVQGSPYGSEAGDSAYQFIRAALIQGHEMICVFFYHEGAYHALQDAKPPEDEVNQAAHWVEMSRLGGFHLEVCISAAQRRGVEFDNTVPAEAAGAGFRAGGLGQWVDACIKADRVLIFRD